MLPYNSPTDIISLEAKANKQTYFDFKKKSSSDEGHVHNGNICSFFYNQLVIKYHIEPNKIQGITLFPIFNKPEF